MIDLSNVSVSYGTRAALRAISFRIEEGTYTVLSGPSGCGKSTLARTLCGLIPHALAARVDGHLRVAGIDPLSTSLAQIATRVGILFQNPAAQLFNLVVEDEVAFGPNNLDLDTATVAQRVDAALDAVGAAHLRNRKVRTLSGGEKQRVAIAAVLAMGPRLLVLDEPTSNLDLPGTRLVVETLERLHREEGLTILLIEHRLAAVTRPSRRLLLMEAGHLSADGPAHRLFADSALVARLGLRPPAQTVDQSWDELTRLPDHQPPRGVSPLVALEGVEAGYRRRVVLRDLDLAIYPGELVALVGDNGAGKTTLARVIAGLLKPSRGRIRFAAGPRPSLAREIGLLFQDPLDQLFCDTVDQEVAFGPRNWGLFDLTLHAETLAQTGLSDLAGQSVHALSSGQQQRTALAASLALRPRLILLDEPTLGQDWGHLRRLMAFVEELNRSGTAVLLITHDYELVRRHAHRVILLQEGCIAADVAL